jgi:regulator of cell morphogenesis and NO signaling
MENDPLSIRQRKINELVGENYVYASVLYYFGIGFYDYSEKTLEEACKENHLELSHVVQSLESVNQKGEEFDIFLMSYPVPLIVEYLKHKHHLFIKKKLPFIAGLIKVIQAPKPQYEAMVEDLKFVFPLFVEDFIHHIYKEEDTLFSYIVQLENALKGKFNPGKLFYSLEKNSLQRFAIEHDSHDDEMTGIRNITNGYAFNEDMGLELKVLFAELFAFEKLLIVHAKVENEVLFPKALSLERQVRKMLQEKIRLN